MYSQHEGKSCQDNRGDCRPVRMAAEACRLKREEGRESGGPSRDVGGNCCLARIAAGVCHLGGSSGRRGTADVTADERRGRRSASCRQDEATGRPRQSSPRTDGRGVISPRRIKEEGKWSPAAVAAAMGRQQRLPSRKDGHGGMLPWKSGREGGQPRCSRSSPCTYGCGGM